MLKNILALDLNARSTNEPNPIGLEPPPSREFHRALDNAAEVMESLNDVFLDTPHFILSVLTTNDMLSDMMKDANIN